MYNDLINNLNMRLCFLDFETYNLCLNFCGNKPWQLGLISTQNNVELCRHNLHIIWPNAPRMSVDAARITHFSPDKLKRLGKAPDEVFEILYRELTKADFIIAHNLLGFDVFLIKEWCLLKNLPWEPFLPKMVDTNCLAKGIELKIPYKNGDNFLAYQYRLYHKKQKGLKTNLTFLGKSHNIEHDYENLHDALNDIELLIKVWEKMKYQLCQV